MRQIIIKHIIQLNQENSLHQYKKRDTRILKSQRLKEIVETGDGALTLITDTFDQGQTGKASTAL